PDGRWVSFNATTVSSSRIYVAAFRGPQPIPQNEWLAVTSGDPWDDNSRWSPDGNLMYFTSEIDGFRCISAQRMDPGTKRPQGPPIPIYHLHHARRSLLNVGLRISRFRNSEPRTPRLAPSAITSALSNAERSPSTTCSQPAASGGNLTS